MGQSNGHQALPQGIANTLRPAAQMLQQLMPQWGGAHEEGAAAHEHVTAAGALQLAGAEQWLLLLLVDGWAKLLQLPADRRPSVRVS